MHKHFPMINILINVFLLLTHNTFIKKIISEWTIFFSIRKVEVSNTLNIIIVQNVTHQPFGNRGIYCRFHSSDSHMNFYIDIQSN